MAHRFKFVVEVELERSEGRFVSRDDMAQELLDAIESADPGSVDVDESSYEVTDWSVSEQ
jgi:hypothetical protein